MSTITQAVAAPPEEQPLDLPPYPVYRFSVEQYQRMIAAGILTEDDRVELLEGWVVPKMVKKPPHDTVIELAQNAIQPRLPADWRIRTQSPITTDDSEPEPDLAIVRGPVRAHLDRHPVPEEVALLTEVADTSLARDRAKCRTYARAKVPFYWIINLIDSQVEVYGDPTGPGPNPQYKQRRVYKGGESIPLVIDGREIAQIPVRDLLP